MSTRVLRIQGSHVQESGDFSDCNNVEFGQTYTGSKPPIRKKKPIKVHSPKQRSGWQKDAAQANYANIRGSSNINFGPQSQLKSYSQNDVCRGSGTQFDEIKNKMTATQMDKILDPKKEAYYTTQPNPKCPSDLSRELCERNQKGTYGFMNRGRPARSSSADAPKTRCPANETKENLERGRGQAGGIIFQTDKKGEYKPAPKLGIGSHDNWEKGHGGAMSAIMDQNTNIKQKYSNPAPPPRAIKGDSAQENAARNKGLAGQLLSEGGRGSVDNKPNPRVRPEAQENASREGAGFRDTLFGGGTADPQPASRVRLGASDNLKRNQGTLTQDQYNYSAIKNDSQPAPRVRPEAQEISRSQQGVITKNLFQRYGKLPGDVPPKPHVQPRARGISRLSRGGAMADCINPVRNYEKKRKKRLRRPASAHG